MENNDPAMGAFNNRYAGISAFYMLDARNLATDKIMYDRWSFLIIDNNNKLLSFCKNCYVLFFTNRLRPCI